MSEYKSAKTSVTALLDPITAEEFTMPMLASDGYTYNLDTLLRCEDGWHLSPITGEVLRPWLYPNTLAATHTSLDASSMKPYKLYDDEDIMIMPPNGRIVAVGLPVILGVTEVMARRAWNFPIVTIKLTFKMLRKDAEKPFLLMHPPCADSMRADIQLLAKLFGIDEFVTNPWCLTTALLCVEGVVYTCEEWYLTKVRPATPLCKT